MDRIFCLTTVTFHRYCLRMVMLGLACSLATSVANAQGRRGGGGFGGADLINRMDLNGNGRLDGDEIPDRMRETLESRGVDLSQGVSAEDFGGAREGIRAQFQGGGDEDGGRGSGGGGRGFGFGGGDEGRGRSSRGGDDDDDSDDDASSEQKPRPRVTFDLPASHSPGDLDGDGQLGMYEWRRWNGHSLREFMEMDGNGDGFVTPREVYVVIGFPVEDGTGDTVAAATSGGSASTSGESSTPGGSEDRLTAEATRYFGILDKDDDDAISLEEWGSSVRIRGMFERGGLDLSEPMSSELFVQHYVRLSNEDDG